jgi:integrase
VTKRDVRGLHHVTSKKREYWYAWRGGPRLYGEYGSSEFWASYDGAIRERHAPEPGKFRSLVTQYRASPDYQKLAPSTKRAWSPWLDRIADHFGTLSIAAFGHPKIRPLIWQWRTKYAGTPRTADMGVQVLSRVCAYAVNPLGKLVTNPCEGIKALYKSDRADKIWTDADIARIKAACPTDVAHAIDLAAATGLRRGDLQRLSWSHIQDDCIVIATSKTRKEAIIPLYADLREVLARIPRRATTVLTNSHGRPWTDVALGNAIMRAKAKAGIGDLHFHDLRGNAATRFYLAGLDMRTIAEIMGWGENGVERIIRKYVSRSAATREVIRSLNKRPK